MDPVAIRLVSKVIRTYQTSKFRSDTLHHAPLEIQKIIDGFTKELKILDDCCDSEFVLSQETLMEKIDNARFFIFEVLVTCLETLQEKDGVDRSESIEHYSYRGETLDYY